MHPRVFGRSKSNQTILRINCACRRLLTIQKNLLEYLKGRILDRKITVEFQNSERQENNRPSHYRRVSKTEAFLRDENPKALSGIETLPRRQV